MFQLGQMVVYGAHGVCRIVEEEKRIVDRKQVVYLVLEPVGNNGSRFLVPSQNAVAMGKLKPILSQEELESLLRADAALTDNWISNEALRKQTYHELIHSADRAKLIGMVRSLYRFKAAQTAAGKKCHVSDENFLRDAEKLLASELSVVMQISFEGARNYLRTQLQSE